MADFEVTPETIQSFVENLDDSARVVVKNDFLAEGKTYKGLLAKLVPTSKTNQEIWGVFRSSLSKAYTEEITNQVLAGYDTTQSITARDIKLLLPEAKNLFAKYLIQDLPMRAVDTDIKRNRAEGQVRQLTTQLQSTQSPDEQAVLRESLGRATGELKILQAQETLLGMRELSANRSEPLVQAGCKIAEAVAEFEALLQEQLAITPFTAEAISKTEEIATQFQENLESLSKTYNDIKKCNIMMGATTSASESATERTLGQRLIRSKDLIGRCVKDCQKYASNPQKCQTELTKVKNEIVNQQRGLGGGRNLVTESKEVVTKEVLRLIKQARDTRQHSDALDDLRPVSRALSDNDFEQARVCMAAYVDEHGGLGQSFYNIIHLSMMQQANPDYFE